jgi:hypothetical protein
MTFPAAANLVAEIRGPALASGRETGDSRENDPAKKLTGRRVMRVS